MNLFFGICVINAVTINLGTPLLQLTNLLNGLMTRKNLSGEKLKTKNN